MYKSKIKLGYRFKVENDGIQELEETKCNKVYSEN